MKFVKNFSIGDTIQAIKFGKTITGIVVKKLPGALVIVTPDSKREVVDVDKIK